MVNTVFSAIGTKIAAWSPQNDLKNLILHLDTALHHNSRHVSTKIEKIGLSRIRHLPDNRNISPYDFWLFGFLKETLKDNQHRTSRRALDLVRRFWPKVKEVL
jgi:hypothetical protein